MPSAASVVKGFELRNLWKLVLKLYSVQMGRGDILPPLRQGNPLNIN